MLTLCLEMMKHLHDLRDVNSDVEHLWPEADAQRAERAQEASSATNVDRETVQLRVAVDELDAALKKADKRVDRLIGERNQLRSLLDRRDREIQKLNRELGGLASGRRVTKALKGAASLVPHSPTNLLASIGQRVRAFFVDEPATADSPAAVGEAGRSEGEGRRPLLARRQNGAAQQIVIAVMFGLERDEIERLLPIVERDCASKNLTPLFLIDVDAFEMMRGRDLLFEYLPPVDDRDRFDPSLHWDLYLQRRLALIRRKWDPVRVVAFGTSATTTLTLWRSSPFEDMPLPAVSVD